MVIRSTKNQHKVKNMQRLLTQVQINSFWFFFLVKKAQFPKLENVCSVSQLCIVSFQKWYKYSMQKFLRFLLMWKIRLTCVKLRFCISFDLLESRWTLNFSLQHQTIWKMWNKKLKSQKKPTKCELSKTKRETCI